MEILHEVPKHDVESEVSERKFVVAKERLCLNEAQDKLVLEDDPEARWLYAIPGDEIPVEEAKRLGLVKEKAAPKKAEAAEPKAAEKSEDKKAAKSADKKRSLLKRKKKA